MYCSYAMFGGETGTTLVMISALTAVASFVVWISIRAAESKGGVIEIKSKNNKNMKSDKNWILGGSILIAAIGLTTSMIYSARISARAQINSGLSGNNTTQSASAPETAPSQTPQPPVRQGGCGI